MSDLKQVKVDNWGIYFLQRLKHFFNRTDYCDLTLQFQDNAQLKVHRLVLNACTEYFELLERTCEMYEDCLVMPDDLQADVVVPIVNFMYTGQLEFRMDSLEKLYQTSLVMSMPVLSKLLEAHRNMHLKTSSHNINSMKKGTKPAESAKPSKYPLPSTSLGKRSFNNAFESNKTFRSQKSQDGNKTIAITNSKIPEVTKNKQVLNADKQVIYREKKYHFPAKAQTLSTKNPEAIITKRNFRPPSPIPLDPELYTKKFILGEPRPTRYELPEELDTDNLFENSFSSISYSSAPLVVHPDATSKYLSKKNSLFSEASSSKRGGRGSSTVDIVECKKITREDNLFEDNLIHTNAEDEIFQPAYLSVKDESEKDSSQLFDQILDGNEGTKVTIEAKDKQTGNLDHAKIISEVLKKYPHLVKSNKNIKLKILNTPTKSARKPRPVTPHMEEAQVKPKTELSYTYETDVLDSKEAAKLIAMGAENIKGPWICLICGTPGRALNFTSYYNFRKHLVEIHREKPVSTICEYCGLKSMKRNYLMHHIYTKHGVPPPPQYHFPKCNMCDYIGLTEGFLVKHKLTHSDNKTIRCGICSIAFNSSSQLFVHMHKTGHTVGSDKKFNLQCIYCMKVFLRESNYHVHLKMNHKDLAMRDGILEDSDDEKQTAEKQRSAIHEILKQNIKYEHAGYQNDYEETEPIQYQVQQRSDGNLHVKKPRTSNPSTKHKILNPGFTASTSKMAPKASDVNNKYLQDTDSSQGTEENIILIDDNEYIMKDNQLIPRTRNKSESSEYIISDYIDTDNPPAKQNIQTMSPATLEISSNTHNVENSHQPKMIVKKSASMNQPIQIVVSNEEEYKALMSSNHSLIFDDGDANKTLTVLTAPHGTTLENAAIELENTESNDMMIIQDDYHINATETVSGDSKFVVVYSHAMTNNDHNKQYQIITPQEIGGQFVQSTEVITQNYETVTTSAPIINTHVIDAHIPDSWQRNVIPNIENQPMQIGSETEIQPIQVGSETEIQTLHVGPETDIQVMHVGSETEIQPIQVGPETDILPIQVGPETEIVHIPVESDTNIQPMQVCTDTEIQPIHVGSETEIQSVQVGSDTEVQPMEVETDINTMTNTIDNSKITDTGNDSDDSLELPEVQLGRKLSGTTLPHIENNNSVVGEVNISDNKSAIGKEIQNSTEEPMDIRHIPTEQIPEKEPKQNSQITYQQEVNTEVGTSEHNTNKENINALQPQPELLVEEPIVEDTGKIIDTTENVMDVCTDNVNTDQILTNIDEGKEIHKQEPHSLIQMLPIYDESAAPLNNENNLPAKVAIEQVQKIASEWSEDEDEAVANEDTETKDIHAETQIETTISKEPELEETIENIEQEMQKQISNTTEKDSINEESSNSFQEATVASPEDITPLPAVPLVNTEATQEKISSLLNDWDDNDSQEEKVDENGQPNVVLTTDSAEENKTGQQIPNKPNAKADDNIKSLVSDWDEEDEENK